MPRVTEEWLGGEVSGTQGTAPLVTTYQPCDPAQTARNTGAVWKLGSQARFSFSSPTINTDTHLNINNFREKYHLIS